MHHIIFLQNNLSIPIIVQNKVITFVLHQTRSFKEKYLENTHHYYWSILITCDKIMTVVFSHEIKFMMWWRCGELDLQLTPVYAK